MELFISMETPKPAKKRPVRSFVSRNRKPLMKGLLIMVVLGVTAGIAYNLGVNQGSAHPKAKTAVTAPNLEKLKEAAKNAPKKAGDAKTNGTSALNNSSGFFRLAGTIQSVAKETIAIKLADGTVVTLAVGKNAKFYTAAPRTAKPMSDLKVGTSAFVIGTIGSTGTFTASNVQAQK